MEDNLSFVIDFQSITDIPMPETFEEQSPQEPNYYVEITLNKKRAYQCTVPDCGKTYRFKSEITRHAIIHQNDRPYRCNFDGCCKTFKRPETLEDHMRIHEGSLPFVCDKPGCGRRFASKPALRYHGLKHKNNREFKCDSEGCDKSFLTMAQLKQHHRSCGLHCQKSPSDVAEDKPYKAVKTESETNDSESVTTGYESIQWETKSQMHNHNASPAERMQEMEQMFQSILMENQILKNKLEQYEKPKMSPRKEGCQIGFQFENPLSAFEVGESLGFDDNYELNFFEFLKSKL